jgi:hypothetical protein
LLYQVPHIKNYRNEWQLMIRSAVAVGNLIVWVSGEIKPTYHVFATQMCCSEDSLQVTWLSMCLLPISCGNNRRHMSCVRVTTDGQHFTNCHLAIFTALVGSSFQWCIILAFCVHCLLSCLAGTIQLQLPTVEPTHKSKSNFTYNWW